MPATQTAERPSNPVIETKIERVTEGIEALTLAVAAAVGTNGDRARAAFDNVSDARAECKAAFRDLITPTLRVVS